MANCLTLAPMSAFNPSTRMRIMSLWSYNGPHRCLLVTMTRANATGFRLGSWVSWMISVWFREMLTSVA